MSKIAIIGAGMAGLSCARVLSNNGHDVHLFDKGRGPGGRMSTRRVPSDLGELSFDHGAQYFTARNPAFAAAVAGWRQNGAVGAWRGKLVRQNLDGTQQPLADETLYVGTPSMNATIRIAAQGLNVTWGTRVEVIVRAGHGWVLHGENGIDLGNFDGLVCGVPAEQVAPLFEETAPDLAAQAHAIESLPCWAGMYAFEAPLGVGFDGARLIDHPIIDFIAYNGSKPERIGPPTYVVHARADWSQQHLEANPEVISAQLLQALMEFSDNRPPAIFKVAHRWRYARVEVTNGPDFLYDDALGIGMCGDWLSGPRVESAWLSGYGLGNKMIASKTCLNASDIIRSGATGE